MANKLSIMKIFILIAFININVAYSQSKQLVDYVNPFLGTEYFGHTFPGSSLPNAMVHLSPDVNTQGWTNAAGYVYMGNSIIGFSHTHWSGVGMTNAGDVLLMPTVVNKIQVHPGTDENPDEGYRSRFDHSQESASPGYYSVKLLDYDVNVELTSTQRAGFHRYTFPETKNARVILDLGHQLGETYPDSESILKIVDNTTVVGSRSSKFGSIYFVAKFSKPFKYYGTFDSDLKTPESGDGIFPYKDSERGEHVGAFFEYDTKKGEQVLVKVGVSYTSIEGAIKNLDAEIPNWDFDGVRKDAKKIWEKELNKVVVSGASEDKKEIFYTSVYHSLLSQYISQDVDGKYMGSDKEVHVAEGYDFYGSFSAWDTYRTQHPLLTLIRPEDVNSYIKSVVAKVHNYNWLPAQHFQNMFGEAMVGDHLIPVIVDAYMKGFRDYDVELLYNAMRKKALENPKAPVPKEAGRSGLDYYIKLGYTPVDKVTESVPNTVELAYDDWCIAQLAKELGKDDDYELFMKRAGNYRNLWHKESEFMRPKLSNGKWLEDKGDREQEIVTVDGHSYYKYFDEFLIGRRPNRHYTESNAWHYIWSVQHDVNGLVELFDSPERFEAKLDTLFEIDSYMSEPKYVGMVGTIGQYVQGNQPSHHVTYLYNYIGKPWKTQFRSRQVMEQLYTSGPGGLCGNDDMGSLSSWYVLSAMGIYPVTPGSPTYVIGSPLFDEVKLKVGKGKTFHIIAKNNSPENKYIQSATLNGKKYTKNWISHQDIAKGGKIVFKMGPKPNTSWGTKKEDLPPSMTK